MNIKSNKVTDIRATYTGKLRKLYPEEEAGSLLDILLLEIAGINRMQRIADKALRLSESEILKIHFACKELMQQRPIQYILGHTDFYGLRLKVNEHVLIPRPETEELVEWIIKTYKNIGSSKILDIGTGSGAIALALSKNLADAEIWALDVSTEALEVAALNGAALELPVKWIGADIGNSSQYHQFPLFDVIVSNPPYVTESDKALMQANVLDYEPAGALYVSDADPLVFYRNIITFTQTHLNSGGAIFMEINERFGKEMHAVLAESGFQNIELRHDLRGRMRMVRAQKPVF
ncbi:MAG: peptide chain release factor N(5)-glutamine methyltransferase [Bacteroidales bacterium]|nr:peptide chain release factor N(5)-glutamine methyltransferase [Bacteroidales bacterium]MDD4177539.1 peptide chain release factor N(5)-glutamine methyltransferase [Bacteroidales bacterium]MDD4742496.1 peptide chain release factor N(5)-glutamine methyltransferase [Bacteroidales bacterium]MDY0334514.1 peptide chain release factor N(5)-glutamine methyltransferase [Bacteroidales bacterium]